MVVIPSVCVALCSHGEDTVKGKVAVHSYSSAHPLRGWSGEPSVAATMWCLWYLLPLK